MDPQAEHHGTLGPVIHGRGYVRSALGLSCIKCSATMFTMPVDKLTAELLGGVGRWFCPKCGWCPSLDKHLPADYLEGLKKLIVFMDGGE